MNAHKATIPFKKQTITSMLEAPLKHHYATMFFLDCIHFPALFWGTVTTLNFVLIISSLGLLLMIYPPMRYDLAFLHTWNHAMCILHIMHFSLNNALEIELH